MDDIKEKSRPKFVYKDKPIPLDKCYQELADMNYQSPVEVIYQGFETKLEGDIMEAIYSHGVDVDKDELIKALKYDRDQYRKGFEDGCKGTMDKIKAEVAREIFEELKQKRKELWCSGKYTMFECWCKAEDEVKKKYTEDKE
jgi:hypothetical protein